MTNSYTNSIPILDGSQAFPYTVTSTHDGWLNVVRLLPSAVGAHIEINGMLLASSGSALKETEGLLFPIKSGDTIQFKNLDTASRAKIIW